MITLTPNRSATSIICGRVRGTAWPDACSDGLGFDLSMAGLTVELMVQQCDKYFNPVFACSSASPPPEVVRVVATSVHKRRLVCVCKCVCVCVCV